MDSLTMKIYLAPISNIKESSRNKSLDRKGYNFLHKNLKKKYIQVYWVVSSLKDKENGYIFINIMYIHSNF